MEVWALHPFHWLSILGATGCAAAAGVLLAQSTYTTAIRCGLAVMLGAVWWSLCEVAWTHEADPGRALLWVKLSAPGWVWIGPLVMHLFLDRSGRRLPRLHAWMPAIYGVGAVVLLVEWTTPWVHPAMIRVPWGLVYDTSAGFYAWYAYTMACVATGLVLAVPGMLRATAPAERSQIPWFLAAIGTPLLVGSVTDGLLPLLGWQPPRIATFSFAVFGLILVWTQSRFGYSVLTPGTFADAILDLLPDGVGLVDVEGRIRATNLSLRRLADRPREELAGLPLAEVFPDLGMQEISAGGERPATLLAAGGTSIPMEVASAALRDRLGGLIGWVLVGRDLREVMGLRSRLARSARLASVGQLAAGIAHEINNPLAYIAANLRDLERGRRQVLENGDGRELMQWADSLDDVLRESLEGVERIEEAVEGVMRFAVQPPAEEALLDVNEVLDEAVRLAGPKLRWTGRVERYYGAVPKLRANPRELENVFFQLLVNAAQAVEQQGAIRLETRCEGSFVVVQIADSGRGIRPEILDRVFDPFFTTRAAGEGLGLGLSIGHEAVRRLGGELRIASNPESGTEVEVYLPVA